jgi:hypothetical protein
MCLFVDLGGAAKLGLCDLHEAAFLTSMARHHASFLVAEWRRSIEAEEANGLKESAGHPPLTPNTPTSGEA